ncbi:MAG: tetratricopeptide repeat protein, partial [Candidatus Magnetoovum sp. WYHC-5]|nr:tetratricopeptide repeat protein [Candidatus Magnetoovum sp. WYHC-5]
GLKYNENINNEGIAYIMKIITIIVLAFLIVGCSKQAKKPDYSNAAEVFQYASKQVDDGDFEEARELLTEIENRSDAGDYAPLAKLKIAESYLLEQEHDLAITQYKDFVNLYPENRYAPYAQYQIASIYFKQIEGRDRGYRYAVNAIEEFEKLKTLYPRNPYREVIPLRIEKSRNILAAHEHYVGEHYFKKASYEAAIGRFNKIIEDYGDYQDIADVYYLLAQSYEATNDFKKAEEFYNKTILKAQRKDLIGAAEERLKVLLKKKK